METINKDVFVGGNWETHLDKAREESCFLNPICDVEKLQDGEQLAQTHHKANRVKGVC